MSRLQREGGHVDEGRQQSSDQKERHPPDLTLPVSSRAEGKGATTDTATTQTRTLWLRKASHIIMVTQ